MILREIRVGSVRVRAAAYRRLSSGARRLLWLLRGLYRVSGRVRFSLDDLRGFYPWRVVLDLFFELESRDFGRVVVGGGGPVFVAFVTSLQRDRYDS